MTSNVNVVIWEIISGAILLTKNQKTNKQKGKE